MAIRRQAQHAVQATQDMDAAQLAQAENLAVYEAWGLDLVAAMKSCDQLDALMITLVYERRLTHRQLSEKLDLPLNMIHKGVARGMRHIGQALIPDPKDPIEVAAG